MDRRSSFKAALLGLVGTLALRQKAEAKEESTPRVVYHLSDLEKVAFVLGNIRNHLEGVGGPENIRIAVVVHGPALNAFRKADAIADLLSKAEGIIGQGVAFEACGNTMKAQKITLEDLLPGFVSAEKGGVVRLAELQHQGWAYLRP
jgi:uncharacterized protein